MMFEILCLKCSKDFERVGGADEGEFVFRCPKCSHEIVLTVVD